MTITNTDILANSPISFPGLFGDWEFTASSVALNIGHGIYWYGIILGLGVLFGMLLCLKQAKHYGIHEDNLLDLVLMGVPLGILGARIYYVLFYLDRFRNTDGSLNWGSIVAIWDGGLAIYGTVIAVFLMAFLYCRRKHIRLGAMTDLCVMGLMLGQAIGRWGNFMNREAFGAETTLPWRMRLTTIYGSFVEVHPTFLYESLWNVLGLCLVLFVISKARHFDGENTWFYFLWYGMGRFWIEGLRTDSLYLFDWTFMGEPIRVSQALSLVMILVSAAMLFYQIRIRHASRADLMVNQLAAASEAETAECAREAETAESTGESTDTREAEAAESSSEPDGEPSAEPSDAPAGDASQPEGEAQPETEAADAEAEAPQSPSEP